MSLSCSQKPAGTATPPSGNMTVSWWPHDRFIGQHSTLLFLFLLGCYATYTPTWLQWGNNENATAKIRRNTILRGGRQGSSQGPEVERRSHAGALHVGNECSPQWTPCTKENEEPHGERTPGAGFTSLFRELQTLCCRKLTRSYGG